MGCALKRKPSDCDVEKISAGRGFSAAGQHGDKIAGHDLMGYMAAPNKKSNSVSLGLVYTRHNIQRCGALGCPCISEITV